MNFRRYSVDRSGSDSREQRPFIPINFEWFIFFCLSWYWVKSWSYLSALHRSTEYLLKLRSEERRHQLSLLDWDLWISNGWFSQFISLSLVRFAFLTGLGTLVPFISTSNICSLMTIHGPSDEIRLITSSDSKEDFNVFKRSSDHDRKSCSSDRSGFIFYK
jgi:hypothetical protein